MTQCLGDASSAGSRSGVFGLVATGLELDLQVASEVEKDEIEDRIEDVKLLR